MSTADLTVTDEQRQVATELATGLRAVADMLDQRPDLAEVLRYSLCGINVPAFDRDTLVTFVRGAKANGATITKAAGTKYFSAICTWGPVALDVFAAREEVCEKVVTGTETVTKQVPDPAKLAEVPLVDVTETVETVEWRCIPLLADAAESRETTAMARAQS